MASRKRKTLWAAFVTGLILSGLNVGVGSASVQVTVGQHAILDGSLAAVDAVYDISGKEFHCSTVNLSGTVAENTGSITLERSFSNCSVKTVLGTLPATITMNGCDYLLHGGTRPGSEEWTMLSDIICPVEHKIELHLYSNASNHSSGTSLCTVKIGGQTNRSHTIISNMAGTPEDLTVDETVSELAYSVSGPAFPCGSSGSNGIFQSDETVKATDTQQAPISLTISGE